MSRVLQIHPANPQPRLITQAVARLREGDVIVYPTDSSYALGCQLGDKAAASLASICCCMLTGKTPSLDIRPL